MYNILRGQITKTCARQPKFSQLRIKKNYSDSAKPQEKPSNNVLTSKTTLWAVGISGAALSGYLAYNNNFFGTKKSEVVEKEIPLPPALIDDLPEEAQYLIIGGGTAAYAAFRSIRTWDPLAKVIVISEEDHFPYMRPPISKELWLTEPSLAKKFSYRQWNDKERSVFFEHEEFYAPLKELNESEIGGVSIVKGHSVTKLDPVDQFVILDNGQILKYKKCLLATGASPKDLPLFENAPKEVQDKVIKYRTLDDFTKLEAIVSSGRSVAIIGGGFLGSELACALSRKVQKLKTRGQIYEVISENANLAKILPSYLSSWTTDKLRGDGVNVLTNADVKQVQKKDDKLQLELTNGETLLVDQVVLSLGVDPNVKLGEDAGLEVCKENGGLLVNSELSACSNLWIAGDVASFYDSKLGRRRLEHHDHAIVTGRLAGENMTGSRKPYWQQSIFWSDLGPDVGFEAIGQVDSSLPTFAVFVKPDPVPAGEEKPRLPEEGDDFRRGVVFYLRDDIIVGMIMWNVFNKATIARRILNESRKFEDLSEVAKLFELGKNELEDED